MIRPAQILVAEALGTALLVAAVVGSGIMAARLSDDVAVQLLANTLSTAAVLYVLITIFGPVSGAQFNPVVTMVLALRRDLAPGQALANMLAQCGGALIGTALAHAMFELPILQVSTTVRSGVGQGLAEAVASFGLILAILGAGRAPVAGLVAAYIASAYWFTASTSFANPAVALARAFTNTFAGIRPADLPLFIVAQIGGALAAALLARWLFGTDAAGGNAELR